MNVAHSLRPAKGYGTAASLQSLRELQSLGVDSVAVTPFGFQRRPGDTSIVRPGTRGGAWISETDEAMRGVIAQAHGLGMRVVLKPHIWLRPPEWPGSIDHADDAAWRAWFASYREFILHYARIAAETRAEVLVIGNELVIASRREAEWRAIIAGIRAIYGGRLTYGANLDEVFAVRFWDALDFIGVSAYFPLSPDAAPGRDALARAWTPIVRKLAALAAESRRPVVFTELGYGSHDYATAHPWEYGGSPRNLRLQADAYEAFFRAVWPQPWFGGVFFWRWESYPDHASSRGTGFEVEHKPAAAVIRRYFRR
jgi:hypothetical protein